MKAGGFKGADTGGGKAGAGAGAGRTGGAAALRVVLADWRRQLLDRRGFLLRVAGGSLAALFAGAGMAVDTASAAGSGTGGVDPEPLSEAERWAIIAAVQQQLFPTEAGSPGAAEIQALDYLRLALQAPDREPDEQAFVLQGALWLEQMARGLSDDPVDDPVGQPSGGFLALDVDAREQLLRRIAASQAGENWLSTLLMHILEALLADSVYGGNPAGIGWAWLGHTPGFPGPKVPYWKLPWVHT